MITMTTTEAKPYCSINCPLNRVLPITVEDCLQKHWNGNLPSLNLKVWKRGEIKHDPVPVLDGDWPALQPLPLECPLNSLTVDTSS